MRALQTIWIVVETPFEGKAGDFFIHGPFPTSDDANNAIEAGLDKDFEWDGDVVYKCWDVIRLEVPVA